MTAPYGRPDALIQTDHGPARVYSARSESDAAIVTDDYELLIPETEIEHLVKALISYALPDPDEPTADDIRDKAGDIAHDLRRLVRDAAGKACVPEDWQTESGIAELHGILTGLLDSLDDVIADLDNLR